jgi:glycosyltransferase involved in cell wall biosynthesis
MQFSIITPSFRSSSWLKLCIASVADQQGIVLEHIVQDACSEDGTQDWLPYDRRVRAFVEKDEGMYDAINRGFQRAEGDILAYLNCDEQYLPDALKMVRDFFVKHIEVDVLLAGTVVVDSNGRYICHRASLVPHRHHMWVRFPVLTSSVFFRRCVIRQRGICFQSRWRDLGDLHWIRALMDHGVSMRAADFFTSTFTDTGENMNLKANALRERVDTYAMAPPWVRLLRPVWIAHHRLRRLAAGHFSLKPTTYSIYTMESPDRRVEFNVPEPTALWRTRAD